MEAPIQLQDGADIFTIKKGGGNTARKSTKRISAKRGRFNGKEALNRIKMCRLDGSEPYNYNITGKSAANETDFKELQKSVQDLILRSKESDQKPFNRTKARSVGFGYDENGRMVPQEKTHLLNAQEMKEITQITSNLIDSAHSTFDKNRPSQSAKHFSTILDSFTEKVFQNLVDDYKNRCPFVGDLLKKVFDCLSFMLGNICDCTVDIETTSQEYMRKSIADAEMFKQKIIELKSRPPITVEREVIVERKTSQNLIDQRKEMEAEIEALKNHIISLKSENTSLMKAKDVWRNASLEMCRLTSGDIKTLELKHDKWKLCGENYIRIIKQKTHEVVDSANYLSESWNDRAVVVFSLCCKSQANVLIHLKSISDNCSKYSTKIINDYNNMVLESKDTTQYQELMKGGEMKRMSDDFESWAKAIEEWIHIDETPGILEARNSSMDLLQSIDMLKRMAAKPELSSFIPSDFYEQLGIYQQRIDAICQWLTKPSGDNASILMNPIVKWFTDSSRLLRTAYEGKQCRFIDSLGTVESLQIRALAFKLSAFSKDLDSFVTQKTDRLKQIQATIPDITFSVTKLVQDMSRPVEDALHSLEIEFHEDNEIAEAWSILYGTGAQGPFKLVSEKTIGLDFIANFGTRLKKWIDSIKSNFDTILSPGTYDEFNLYLHDWFDTAESIIKRVSKFMTENTTQTDPVRIADSKVEFMPLNKSRSSSEASFMSTLSRVDTESVFDVDHLSNTGNFLLFDISPSIDFVRKRQPKSRNFSGVKTSFITNDHPASPMKSTQNTTPASWTIKTIKEMFEYRKTQSTVFRYGDVDYFFCNTAADTFFRDFAISKTSKQVYKEFLRKITEGIANSKSESDPLLYMIKMFKTETWSKHTFNFATTLYLNSDSSTMANPYKFVERVFSPFGFSVVRNACNVVGLLETANMDVLFYACCSLFENIFLSKAIESNCLFKKLCEKDFIAKENFKAFLSIIRLATNPNSVDSLVETFYKNSNKIDEFNFRCLCLYCGVFCSSCFVTTNHPFGLCLDTRLVQIKNFISRYDYKNSVRQLSKIIDPLLIEATPDEYTTFETFVCLEHAVNVLLRNISTSYSSSTFITIAPQSYSDQPISSLLVPPQ